MIRHRQATPLASAARTATATSSGVGCEGISRITVHSILSAFTSGTCVVTVEVSPDNTNFSPLSPNSVDATGCDSQGAAGTESAQYDICAKYFRVVATGASTPIYTNTVIVDMHQDV